MEVFIDVAKSTLSPGKTHLTVKTDTLNSSSDRTSTITPSTQRTNSNTTPNSASTKAAVKLNDKISSASPSMNTPGMTSTTEKMTGNVTSAKKELCGVMCQTTQMTGMPASGENSTSITTSPSTKTSRHMATTEMTSTANPKILSINVTTTATSSEDLSQLQYQTESMSQNKTNNETDVSVFPAGQTDNKLKMVAFGVISFILLLIIVMVILVSVVNLRGKCRGSKEADGKKIGDSVVSESNATINGEKESIMLISMKSLITETDSPRMSCVFRSPESEDGDLSIDAYSAKYI
ncbi:endothelial cell-specific chemotaxis regulator isoform X2 [Erpetoichthys calabaricus]|uniref:endothelial cell-specific chemotaxis regulator isoform X2 n=1 Tax=Erpetoichthys calabaricus TaxID=27687 RepID=UPI0022349536|nr:endothelial cell-specific chemotaxis regulator isoform X2 [Erpetoichthys calabaricus]